MNTSWRIGLGTLLLLASLQADQRDRSRDEPGRRREPGRVIVYQNASFGGDSLVLHPGDALANMAGATFDRGGKLNDSISSIRIEGDLEVYAYQHADYRGDSLRLTESVRDLTGRLVGGALGPNWNDRISSIRVERRQAREPADPAAAIQAAFTDLLGRAPTPDERQHFHRAFTEQGWNERMLRDHLRREERYRSEAADHLVRRAYREVLGREVDPEGARHYRHQLLQRGWSEGDVRDDLQRSKEYRDKPRG
jgi:hypothetical protein